MIEEILYLLPFLIVWFIVIWALRKLLPRIGITRIPYSIALIISLVIAGLIYGVLSFSMPFLVNPTAPRDRALF